MLPLGTVVLRYAAFAAVAGFVIILAKETSLPTYHGVCELAASILMATRVGFVVKYVLDHRFGFVGIAK